MRQIDFIVFFCYPMFFELNIIDQHPICPAKFYILRNQAQGQNELQTTYGTPE